MFLLLVPMQQVARGTRSSDTPLQMEALELRVARDSACLLPADCKSHHVRAAAAAVLLQRMRIRREHFPQVRRLSEIVRRQEDRREEAMEPARLKLAVPNTRMHSRAAAAAAATTTEAEATAAMVGMERAAAAVAAGRILVQVKQVARAGTAAVVLQSCIGDNQCGGLSLRTALSPTSF